MRFPAVEGRPARATGNHLSAANDEPELFSQDELLSADVSLSASKSERNDHEAFVNQVRMSWEI